MPQPPPNLPVKETPTRPDPRRLEQSNAER